MNRSCFGVLIPTQIISGRSRFILGDEVAFFRWRHMDLNGGVWVPTIFTRGG